MPAVAVFRTTEKIFCPTSSYLNNTETILEEIQNFSNWSKAAGDVLVPRYKRVLAKKIHKLKKILKFGSNFLAKKRTFEEHQNNENEIEHRQNGADEVLHWKLAEPQQKQQHHFLEEEQNMVNENWENWDSCNLYDDHPGQPPQFCYPLSNYPSDTNINELLAQPSIRCVFMPDQPGPVPAEFHNPINREGIMWIS